MASSNRYIWVKLMLLSLGLGGIYIKIWVLSSLRLVTENAAQEKSKFNDWYTPGGKWLVPLPNSQTVILTPSQYPAQQQVLPLYLFNE